MNKKGSITALTIAIIGLIIASATFAVNTISLYFQINRIDIWEITVMPRSEANHQCMQIICGDEIQSGYYDMESKKCFYPELEFGECLIERMKYLQFW